jgi:hypothetical protein
VGLGIGGIRDWWNWELGIGQICRPRGRRIEDGDEKCIVSQFDVHSMFGFAIDLSFLCNSLSGYTLKWSSISCL